MKFTVKREVEAKYLNLCVSVKYGDEDMPFDAPMRVGDSWKATIDLDSGCIEGWPKGKTLTFYMKVCDSGTYVLLDANRKELACIDEDYVPNLLLPGEYGDYLSLAIDETGKITNWLKSPSLKDFEEPTS